MPEKDGPEHIPNVLMTPMFAEIVGGINLVGYVHIIISTCGSESESLSSSAPYVAVFAAACFLEYQSTGV
jgi:hypothetical protein